MGISSVTETPQVPAAPAPSAPVAAPVAAPVVVAEAASAAPAPKAKEANAPVKTSPPPPPPPPPKGYDLVVKVGQHEASGHRVYGFLDPDSGEVVVQIPIEEVLDMVANIVAKLKSEGRA